MADGIPQASTEIVNDGPTLLRNLAQEIGDSWFEDLCELAIAHPDGKFHPKLVCDLHISFADGGIISHWLGRAASNAESPAPTTAGATQTRVVLKQIGPFVRFRKLNDHLVLQLERNFTLVFGTNGSGKSSVSLALRCLAREDEPEALLNCAGSADEPGFKYHLAHDAVPNEWSKSHGYGLLASDIAYFDGKVAHRLVHDSAKPEQAIEISPFGLDVFQNAGLLLDALSTECNRQIDELMEARNERFEALRKRCTDIQYLAGTKDPSDQGKWLVEFANTAINWNKADDARALEELEAKLKTLQKGLRPGRTEVLQSQHGTLSAVLPRLQELTRRLIRLSRVNEQEVAAKRTADINTRNGLLGSVLTSGTAEDAFLRLLKQANIVHQLDEDSEVCPLCDQNLSEGAKALFGKYKLLLSDTILAEIDEADKKLRGWKADREGILSAIEGWTGADLGSWLDSAQLEECKDAAIRIQTHLTSSAGEFEVTSAFRDDLRRARELVFHLRTANSRTTTELAELQEGQGNLENEIKALESNIHALKVRQFRHEADSEVQAFVDARKEEKNARSKVQNAGWQDKRTKLTRALKAANDRLVKAEFSKTLDQEYRRITDGLGMDHFGVSIEMEAAKQSISLTAAVSGKHRIPLVLSEGEQRLHAIALFFAEAEVRDPSILVFDDPSTSFDYNFTEGVVFRLTKYAEEHPESQIIVFTHNWEFFAKLDRALRDLKRLQNAGGLDFARQALVLEYCETVKLRDVKLAAQRENIDQAIRSLVEPPSESQIRSICADIRAWIEDIINKYVFNSQRQSYKTRHSSTLDMPEFMKVRPLKKEYAIALNSAADKTSERIHKQGGTSQIVLPNATQLREIFSNVDDVHKKMTADREADPGFNNTN